jgi:hypothetical protein
MQIIFKKNRLILAGFFFLNLFGIVVKDSLRNYLIGLKQDAHPGFDNYQRVAQFPNLCNQEFQKLYFCVAF